MGASGLDLFSGSPIEVYMETVREGEEDVRRIKTQTAWNVYGARVTAVQQRAYGGYAMAEGWAKTGTTVMGAATSYYAMTDGKGTASDFWTGGIMGGGSSTSGSTT